MPVALPTRIGRDRIASELGRDGAGVVYEAVQDSPSRALALAQRRKLLGDDHPQVGQTLTHLAGLLRSRGDAAAAEPLYVEALAILQRRLPSGHANTSTARWGLAGCLVSQNRFAEAEPLLRQAQAEVAGNAGASPRLRRRVLEGLVDLYAAWHAAEPDQGNGERAAQWRKKLEAWQASTQPSSPTR